MMKKANEKIKIKNDFYTNILIKTLVSVKKKNYINLLYIIL